MVRPDFVADCFLKLVKTGSNGDAMVVLKNYPPFIYGDPSKQMITALAMGAKLTEKVNTYFSLRFIILLLVPRWSYFQHKTPSWVACSCSSLSYNLVLPGVIFRGIVTT